MRLALITAACAVLAGCAFQVTMMPRDSGKVYLGQMSGSGGVGTMTMNIEAKTCTGPVVRVGANETFGFANTFGTNSRGVTTTGFTTISTFGDVYLKALLSCSDGGGLRCDISGRFPSGGGICADDTGRVFDMIAVAGNAPAGAAPVTPVFTGNR